MNSGSREFNEYPTTPMDIFALTLLIPKTDPITVASSTTQFTSYSSNVDDNSITLKFSMPTNLPPYLRFNCSVTFTAAPQSSSIAVSMNYEFDASASDLSIYDATIRFPFNILKTNQIFFPAGYGNVATGLSQPSWSGNYPSGTTMQYMAVGDSEGASSSLYFAAHDNGGTQKTISYCNSNATAKVNAALQFTHVLPNATRPMFGGSVFSFDFVLASLPSTTATNPLWQISSDLYRKKFAKKSPWSVKAGKILDRVSETYANTHLWINSGWQCHDVFDETQGDPSVVMERVSALMEMWRGLGLPEDGNVALHYYEWQQGPDASAEGRYKFDTHYPDYFPARVNGSDTFSSVTREMFEEYGVLTFPYINGRCVDMDSNTYVGEDGEVYATKGISKVALEGEYDVVTHVENYGNGINFAVMNPQSVWWQDKTASIVDQLVHQEGVFGVYVDQIGAAPIQLCFDPQHGHDLGNGNWWVAGYESMLEKVHDSGDNSPIVTEDNAEVYLNQVEGFLTLVPFNSDFAEVEGETSSVMTPAFASVYGGQFIGFGAEWYASDFADKSWLKAKLATELVYGISLGWFGLGGIKDDPDCGTMRLYELFIDEGNKDVNEWIVKMVLARDQFKDFILQGRVVSGVEVLNNPAYAQNDESVGVNSARNHYRKISHASWLREETGEVGIILVKSIEDKEEEESQSVNLDMEVLGFLAGDEVAASLIDFEGGVVELGTFGGGEIVNVSIVVAHQTPVLLRLRQL